MSDKGWSLTDCSSFILMEQERLTAALTYDRHFTQAGFQILLR
jgi:predicted nucleic acid-binding protein